MYDEVLHEHLWNGVKFLYFMVLKLQKCVHAYSSPYGIYYIKNIHINIASECTTGLTFHKPFRIQPKLFRILMWQFVDI